MKKKREQNSGGLNEAQTVAPRDQRGKKADVKKNGPKAPDGISGDWT